MCLSRPVLQLASLTTPLGSLSPATGGYRGVGAKPPLSGEFYDLSK